jgi:hypothetical protein
MSLRTLSSAQTFWIKFVIPGLWTPLFGAGMLALWPVARAKLPPYLPWFFLLAWLAGIVFSVWIYAGLKRVRMDQDTLYISNFLREIAVPLSEVDSVTEKRWIRSHPVTIVLRHPTELGDKITFLPTVRLFTFAWEPHPVVEQIEMAAYMKRFREAEAEKSGTSPG